MAAIIYYFGVVFCLFVALQQGDAVSCYRCVYIEEEGAEVEGTTKAPEASDNENGNAEAQTAEKAATYGNSDCKEDGEEFRIDYVTQDECVGELELAPVGAYKAVSDATTWNQLLGLTGEEMADATKFVCQKTKFSMSSTEHETKVNVWYRGCAYELPEDCQDIAEMKEKDLFQSIYADMYGVKKESVTLEGEGCGCALDTCNGAVTSQISLLLAALVPLAIFAVLMH